MMDTNKMVEEYFAQHKEEIDAMLQPVIESMKLSCMMQLTQALNENMANELKKLEMHYKDDLAKALSGECGTSQNTQASGTEKRITREELLQLDLDEKACGIYEYPERAEVSNLRKLGYSVSKDSGMSDAERQDLLRMIIETGQMTKWQVLNHIHYLIKINGKSGTNSFALKRWKSDYDYVNSL